MPILLMAKCRLPMLILLFLSLLTPDFVPTTSSAAETAGSAVETASGSAEEEIYVRINQAGYLPAEAKIAHAQARTPLPEKFSIVNRVTGQIAFAGPAKIVAGRWGQFDHHAELDFSALKKPG